MKKTTLKMQLTIALVLVGLVPFLVMGITSYITASSSLKEAAVNKLEIARDLKSAQFKQYVKSTESAINELGRSKATVEMFNELVRLHKHYEIQPTEDYDRVLESPEFQTDILDKYDAIWQRFMEEFHMDDIYMICKPHGHTMYTAKKGKDLGQNIGLGKDEESALNQLWKEVVSTQSTVFADMAPYPFDDDNPHMFLGTPITDMEGKMLGVVAARLNQNILKEIMNNRTGMGETGETYLVGSDHLMRSDSFLNPKEYSVKASFAKNRKIETEAVKEALAGVSDVKIIVDYNGNPVMSAYKPVELFGTTWAMMAEQSEWEVFEAVDNLAMIALVMGLVFLVLVVGIALYLGSSISKPILNSVRTITEASTQVTSASDQIASSATSLAEGATEQASSVEEISATVEQSTAINNQNAENAKEADGLAKSANDSALRGNEKIKALVDSMEGINESSQQISKIIKTIDEIAFQTNLLALNAAVEAARAGEHGMGFAVVADEVKSLAQRSADAAKETANIIDKSIEQIKQGNASANETNEVFSEILEGIQKTSNIIGEISVSVREQSEGMNQVADAMGQIDEVTQQNAANSEEAAAAAEELNAQALSLQESVKQVAALVGYDMGEVGQTASFSKPAKHLPHIQKKRGHSRSDRHDKEF